MVNSPPSSRRRLRRVDWRQVGILYRRELRAALRERNIVINSILLPIFLYPVFLWAIFSGIMFVQGQTAGFQSRVFVPDWPAAHTALRERLAEDERLQLVPPGPELASPEDRITSGRLDAVLELTPATGDGAAVPGNFDVQITFDESKDRSAGARRRIEEAVRQYRSEWLTRTATTSGLNPAAWQQFTVAERNVASARETGTFILGMMLPMFFVIMVAMGAFYPAIDATAGERERNTWETLMTTGASRVSIVVAKYLYVTTLAGLAGILNLTAMIVTLGPIFAPMVGKGGGDLQFSIPWSALPMLALAAALLAGFVAAGMMILASFARTFKEGQAMITPFYLVIMLPVMFLQSPGLTLSPVLACVPIVNVVMLVRTVITGSFPWLPITITIAVSLLVIAACLRFAAFILRFEDVLLGAYSGNIKRFVRE